MDDAVRSRKDAFAPELYNALKADRDAQARSPHELVGLDFDPFLNAQDVPEKYEIGAAAVKGSSSMVPVLFWWGGKRSEKPDVTAEVACKDKACQFINFYYGSAEGPENENLIAALKALTKDRKKK